MRNNDDECFRWCHLAHRLATEKDPQRVSKYRNHVNELDYSGVEFPVRHNQYGMVEKQNAINVNVFRYEDRRPFPIYVSQESNEDVLNLLLIIEGKKQHYVYIKNFNRFMFRHGKNSNGKHFFMHCLQCFSSETILENHKEVCVVVNGKQAIKMPPAGSTL